jgi:acyl carrier protein
MTGIVGEVQVLLRQHYGLTSEQTLPDQKLVDLGIDSLTAIEFMFALEDRFNISLAEARRDLVTVADVATLVEETLRQAPAPS